MKLAIPQTIMLNHVIAVHHCTAFDATFLDKLLVS